jgi:mono/diheme cytochrome c family protein
MVRNIVSRALAVIALPAAVAAGPVGFVISSSPAQAAVRSHAKVSASVLKQGETIFKSNCGSCHTLANAKTKGMVGPNLDQLKPSDALVTHQVTYGGGPMPAFGKKGLLSKTQIKNVAAYVSSVAGKK